MTYEDPSQRQPKGDHNRRLSLGLDPDQFAVEAGVSVDGLRTYEQTAPDHGFDIIVAARVGDTLNRLEAILPNSQTGRQEPLSGVAVADVGRPPSYLEKDFMLAEEAEMRESAEDEATPLIEHVPNVLPDAPPDLGEEAESDKNRHDHLTRFPPFLR